MSKKLHALLKFHKFIGGLICDEMGHDWEPISFSDGSLTMNTANVERCTRCGDTRSDIGTMGSTNGNYNVESIEVRGNS